MGSWADFKTCLLTLAIAFIGLTIYQLYGLSESTWFVLITHDIVLIAIFFLIIGGPYRINLLLVWVAGLCVDTLASQPLGFSAACYVALVWASRIIFDVYGAVNEKQTRALILLWLLVVVAAKNTVAIFVINLELELDSLIAILVTLGWGVAIAFLYPLKPQRLQE